MKKIIGLFLIALSFNLYAQNKDLQEIKDAEKDIFKIKVMEYQDRKFTVMYVDTLDLSNYLYDFVQQNRLILDYLLQNQLKVEPDTIAQLVNDIIALKKYFYDSIEKDTAFTNNITNLISRYLKSQNTFVTNYHLSDKYNVSIDKIASIAARFFYPNKLVEDGGISMKLCVGALSFKDYGTRNYLEEAFAFSVVMGSAQSENPILVEEYKKEGKFALHMNLSNNDEIKLYRLQGAIWALLSRNSKMLEEIKNEYDKKEDILPFKIIF